jgi:hypothetical protein
VGLVRRCFCSRQDLLLENLVLRQQLSVFTHRKKRPTLAPFDKLFWIGIKTIWSRWRNSLVMVTPETVVRWHREGFRKYWRWRSRHRVGRKRITRELRELIFQMVSENPTWGAPRIHGELLKLGFEVSERSVSRWMERAPKNPGAAGSWKVFLSNHREAIAAMDLFTVPTLTFGVLYCFFVIAHDRRRILHFQVTGHPNSFWIAQQLREAFPFEHSLKYLLKRLLSEYVRYYHDDRTHLGLKKETPGNRKTGVHNGNCRVVSSPRLGGLHHRYDLAA